MSFLRRTLHFRFLVWQGFSRPNNFFRLSYSTNSFFLVRSSLSRLQLSTMAQKKPFERLPTSVLPKNYKLTLKPNLTEFTFTGEEVIDVEVSSHTTSMYNAFNLRRGQKNFDYFSCKSVQLVPREILNFKSKKISSGKLLVVMGIRLFLSILPKSKERNLEVFVLPKFTLPYPFLPSLAFSTAE